MRTQASPMPHQLCDRWESVCWRTSVGDVLRHLASNRRYPSRDEAGIHHGFWRFASLCTAGIRGAIWPLEHFSLSGSRQYSDLSWLLSPYPSLVSGSGRRWQLVSECRGPCCSQEQGRSVSRSNCKAISYSYSQPTAPGVLCAYKTQSPSLPIVRYPHI